MTGSVLHQAVLPQEAITALAIVEDGVYIDATFGRGGHSLTILQQLGAQGQLIAIDRDPDAIAAGQTLVDQDSRVTLVQARFSQLQSIVEGRQLKGKVNGVLFDLGVSSPQLDNAERGFSFMRDGPLDMRMDPAEGISAAEWLNQAGEGDIADVLYQYGEERHSRRIARRIVQQREAEPIRGTARLAAIVKEAHPAWEKGKHPATRVFQAIRIFINGEFEELTAGLEQALNVLQPGGRMAVISFHSLEDRQVKRFMAKAARGDDYPRHLPVPSEMLNPKLRIVGKAIKPADEEIARNVRARSAVLRVAEKLH